MVEGCRMEAFLRPSAVGIICLVVHHQLVVHKVEAVRLCLVRVQDHLTHWERERDSTQRSKTSNPSKHGAGVFVSSASECVTLTHFLGQRGELINVLARVLAAGHAEAKLKVKTLEQLLSEIVPLNHPEILYRSVSDCELNTGRKNIHRQGSIFPLLTVSLSIKIHTHILTYVAPTCRSRRNAGVNW